MSESHPLLPTPLHSQKIHLRPRSHGSWAGYLFFAPVFVACCVGINVAQVVVLGPLGIVRGLLGFVGLGKAKGWVGGWYDAFVGVTKGWFALTLILITTLFAPTSLILTSDSSLDLATLVRPYRADQPEGRMEIVLPENLVIVGNHQCFLDWLYIWILGQYTTTTTPSSPSPSSTAPSSTAPPRKAHGSHSLSILLKQSLKHIPILGWGMQFFEFIFLARNWAADRGNLTRALREIGGRVRGAGGGGVWLLIFPEGTITSDEERAKSKRFAEREGIPDFVNTLHPRSTGLLFCLRTLLPQIPDLKILDVTIGYPGVGRGEYAQEYYALLPVFLRGVPPPAIHMHLRLIDPLSPPLPGLGSLLPPSAPSSDAKLPSPSPTPSSSSAHSPAPVEVGGLATEQETKEFTLWLRKWWEGKEGLLDGFVRDGRFGGGEGEGGRVMPIRF